MAVAADVSLTPVDNQKELELKIKKLIARQGGIGGQISIFYRNATIQEVFSNGIQVLFHDSEESEFIEFYLVKTSVGNALVPKSLERSKQPV